MSSTLVSPPCTPPRRSKDHARQATSLIASTSSSSRASSSPENAPVLPSAQRKAVPKQDHADLLDLELQGNDDADNTVDALFRKWRVGEIRGIESTARYVASLHAVRVDNPVWFWPVENDCCERSLWRSLAASGASPKAGLCSCVYIQRVDVGSERIVY
jgi:hypothetical protein